MVEDPAQAVFMIDWDDRKNLEAFLASPACDDFLRLLPEEVPLSTLPKTENNSEISLHDPKTGNSGFANNELEIQQPLEAALDEPQPVAASKSASASTPILSPSPRSDRSRFLTIDRLDQWSSIQIQDRITLSVFLVSADNKDDLVATFQEDEIRGILGYEHCVPDLEYVDHDRSRFNFAIDFSWFCGSAVGSGCVDKLDPGERLEWLLLGNPPADGQSQVEGQGGGPGYYAMCEITQWNVFGGKEEMEEKVVQDVGFNREWEQEAQAMKADGVVKAWKRERWDLRPCPGFVS